MNLFNFGVFSFMFKLCISFCHNSFNFPPVTGWCKKLESDIIKLPWIVVKLISTRWQRHRESYVFPQVAANINDVSPFEKVLMWCLLQEFSFTESTLCMHEGTVWFMVSCGWNILALSNWLNITSIDTQTKTHLIFIIVSCGVLLISCLRSVEPFSSLCCVVSYYSKRRKGTCAYTGSFTTHPSSYHSVVCTFEAKLSFMILLYTTASGCVMCYLKPNGCFR